MQVDTSHIENRPSHSTRLPARHPNLHRSSVNFQHWWCCGLRGGKPWIFHCRLLTHITVNSVSVCACARVNGGFVWLYSFNYLVFFIYLWFNVGFFFIKLLSLVGIHQNFCGALCYRQIALERISVLIIYCYFIRSSLCTCLHLGKEVHMSF